MCTAELGTGKRTDKDGGGVYRHLEEIFSQIVSSLSIYKIPNWKLLKMPLESGFGNSISIPTPQYKPLALPQRLVKCMCF